MAAVKLDDLSEDPFWRWCSTQFAWGARMDTPKDLVLSPVCSTRFALQVDPDGELSFGSVPEDMDGLSGVRWTNAHMIRDLRGKGTSYVALHAKDVNGEGADGDEPCELRVFFPVDGAKMDAFLEADPKPSKLRLRALRVRRGLPTFASTSRVELDLKLTNFEAAPVRQTVGSLTKGAVGALMGKGAKGKAKGAKAPKAAPPKGNATPRPGSPQGPSAG